MTRRQWVVVGLLSLVTVVVLFPVYWMVMTAIMPTSAILSRNPPLLPDPALVSFAGFAEAWQRRPLGLWILNSVLVSGAATVLSLVIATLAGYSLSRWSYRPQQLFGASLLLSKLIPNALIIIPIFMVYGLLGLADSFAGLVVAHLAVGVPLATWLMKGFFDRIPRELELAAMIDGCSELTALWYVVLPLARPGLTAAGVYLVIVGWSEFVFARTLMSSGDRMLLTVGLQSFVGEYVVDWSTLMAAGTISLTPILALFLVMERFLASGMTKGALAN